MIGNPFGTNISVDAVITALDAAFTAVNGSVYIWDPTLSSGNGDFASLTSGDAIAPFQAFFVRLETLGENGSFSLDNSSRTNTAATFLKEPEQNFPKLILSVNENDTSDKLAFHFRDDGDLFLDRNDVYELTSLASKYVQIFSLVGDQGLSVNNLPFQPEEPITLPIFLNSTESSIFNLKPTFEEIPDKWKIELENVKTGQRIHLLESSNYSFEYNSTIQKKDRDKPVLSMNKTEQNHQFNLIISPSGNGSIDEELPEAFNLKQNYPNPFNPSTRIEYNLSEQSRVSIKIYDMMGREIDTLISEQMPAGTHQVVWNAENRSSGIYIYRLETSGVTFTKKMTLIK